MPIGFSPGSAGFTGSFSKSASSSFASSSASSSSSSYSFAGSGIPNVGGGGGAPCTSGACSNSDTNGHHAPNANINDFYSTNGANGAAAAQSGALAGSQYNSKDNTASPCTGNNCNPKETDCKGPNCNEFSSPGDKCDSGRCGPSSPSVGPSENGNEPNHADSTTFKTHSPDYENGNNNLNSLNAYGNKCTSGSCGAIAATGISSPDYNPTSDRGDVPTGSNENPNKCNSGQCGGPDYVSTGYEPSGNPNKCTSGKCGESVDASTGYESKGNPSKCASGQCAPDLKNCASGKCFLPPTGNIPSANDNDIPVNVIGRLSSTTPSSNCISGNCGTLPTSRPTVTYPYGYSNLPKSNSNQNLNTPTCISGNCNNNAYNPHTLASAGASAPAYSKPVQFLTAPKQEPSCTSPNCQTPGVDLGTPGKYPSGTITSGSYPSAPGTPSHGCSNGNCGSPQYPTTESNSITPISKYPSKCTTPNCAFNYPQVPTYQPPQSSSQAIAPSGIPNYNPQNIPHHQSSPETSFTSPSFNAGSKPSSTGADTPITGPTSPNYVSTVHSQGDFSSRPTYSSTLPSSVPESNIPIDDGSVPAFVPLNPSKSPNCLGSSCSNFPPISVPNYGQNSFPASSGQPISPSSTQPTYSPIPTHPSPDNLGKPITSSNTNYLGAQSTTSAIAGASAKKPEIPYQGGFGGPSGLLKPNEFTIPSNNSPITNTKPAISVASNPCTTGNCNSQGNQPHQEHVGASNVIGTQAGSHAPSCITGNCGESGTFNLNGASAAAGAVASASAVAYTGGFGGPPGLLAPFDSGKDGNAVPAFSGKNAGGSPIAGGHSAITGGPSTFNNGVGDGTHAGAAAQAVAVAGASAGAIGAPYGYNANGGHGAGGGCGGGCGGSGSYGAGRNIDLNTSLDHPKTDFGGLHGAISGATAAAKAGAVSYGGSFASAHASSGAAVKGGKLIRQYSIMFCVNNKD